MGLSDGLYLEAAKIVGSVKSGKGRIKSLCFSSKFPNKKLLFALVTGACKNFDLISKVIDATPFPLKEFKGWKSLAIVLLQDFFHDRSLGCSPSLSEPILQNGTKLKAEFARQSLEIGVSAEKDNLFVPKYARVNTLKSSLDECLEELQRAGFEPTDSVGALKILKKLYQNGHIILQDKASCLPAFILDPPPGSSVVDSCAAPGNKTTHLAALVGLTGRVLAFERDERRSRTLQATLKKHGCTNATAICQDFLQLDPLDHPEIEYALVDPSCSGSGILENHEAIAGEKHNLKSRLQPLANFQCMIIKHAMKFPNLKRLVYSTCSIHREENEEVVKEILETNLNFELMSNPLPSWPRRGLSEYQFARNVIRAAKEDGMHGFFVACFVKRTSSH